MAPYGSIRILDPSHLLPPDADGTIRVAPHPAYENAVLALLHSIVGSHVGRVVINAIAHRHGWDSMLIVPHGKGDHANKAIMLDSQGGRHKGVVDYWTDSNNKRHHVNGTGAGSSAVIHFSPHSSHHGQSCHAAGSQADEILIHEAFHGLRQLLGMMHKRPVGDKYDDEEEFFAKLIENIYISEKYPHRHLRANHHGHTLLHLPGPHSQSHHAVNISKAFLHTRESKAGREADWSATVALRPRRIG